MAESTPQAAAPASENLELIIEGWGAKQGTKYPNWNVRWFVLEKKTPEPDSLEVLDTRDYFKHSSDSYERAHNYNSSNDKANLVAPLLFAITRLFNLMLSNRVRRDYWVPSRAV
eukprot:gene21492-27320_t